MSLNKTLLTAIFLQLNLKSETRSSCTRPKREEVDADLILANDPDADRVGIAKNLKKFTIQRNR